MAHLLHRLEDEFPYYIEGVDNHKFIRSFMDWLILEKIMPETGKRITESYVDSHPELDEETKQNIINTRNVVASRFVVVAKNGLNVKLKNMKDGIYYNVMQVSNNPQIQANTIILGRIFPYGSIYRFAGAMILQHTPLIVDPDIMMHAYEKKEIERAENIFLTPHAKLAAALNKYPFQWVDGICQALSLGAGGRKNEKVKDIANKIIANIASIINELPEKSKKALTLVMNSSGIVKYSMLKEYDDEIPFWWSNRLPSSTIGLLRLYGLIVIGKMPQGTKMCKIAMIPKDVKEELEKLKICQND